MRESGHEYELVVIGGGSGGVRAARLAAAAGLSVAIVEKSRWGGTCVNLGCVPKKMMKYASDFSRDFADAAEYGWQLGEAQFSWPHFMERKDREIERLNGIYAAALERVGAELIQGQARIHGPNRVEVNGSTLHAQRILIATGGRPFVPSLPGSQSGLNSDQIFHLPRQPKKILIVGGGFIAAEFAAIFCGLGTSVTQIYRGDLFMRGFDKDLRMHLAEELRHQGVDLRFNTDVAAIELLPHGNKRVTFLDSSSLEVDEVLFATGRTPYIEGLWDAELAIELDESGAIQVDKNFRTSVNSIYAIGDVVGRMALTPVAITEAKALIGHWLNGKAIDIDYRKIPQAVFSSPTLATVGYTEEEALEEGHAIEIYETRFRTLKHSLTSRSEKTYMKLVVEQQSRRVLGIHLAGEEMAEILQCAAVAMNMGARKEDFDRTVGMHPTSAEELVTLNRVVRSSP